jgi:hypothetical protein
MESIWAKRCSGLLQHLTVQLSFSGGPNRSISRPTI